MRDAELRAALEGTSTHADPAFRMRVLERICERARRRTMLRRAAVWIGVGIGTGFVAQALTPPEAGMPGLEIAAMCMTIGATALAIAQLTLRNIRGRPANA